MEREEISVFNGADPDWYNDGEEPYCISADEHESNVRGRLCDTGSGGVLFKEGKGRRGAYHPGSGKRVERLQESPKAAYDL